MSRMGRNPFQQPKPARPETASPGPASAAKAGIPPRAEPTEGSATGSARETAAKLLAWAATEIPAQGIVLAVKAVGFVAGFRRKQ